MDIKRTSTLSSTTLTSQPLPTVVWITEKSKKLAGFYPKSPLLVRAIPSTIFFDPDATVVEVDPDSDEERVAGCEILINGKLINEIWVRDEDPTETQETRMWLKCIPLSDLNLQGKGRKTPMQQGNTNTLTMMNESKTSVGKKRPRGSEEEQWLCSSSSEPTNQPNRRHIAIDEDQKCVN
ncbi:unnamed protein product [Prunus armeniaca]